MNVLRTSTHGSGDTARHGRSFFSFEFSSPFLPRHEQFEAEQPASDKEQNSREIWGKKGNQKPTTRQQKKQEWKKKKKRKRRGEGRGKEPSGLTV